MEDGDSLPRVQEDKESAQPVQYAKSTWRALAAVATEHRHALRHALDNTPAVESTGEVHQHHESTTISTAGLKRSQQSFDSLKQPADGDLRKTSAPPDVLDAAEFHEAVRAEVQRVTPKTTFWDSEKDVVVRLEFMRSGASRVTSLVIAAAICMGAVVLLAEFVKKLQLGSSPYYFNHTALFSWNAAVATLCLAVLTPSVGIHVWNLLWAFKHKKTWHFRIKVSATLLAVEAAVQWINLVFYLAPNVYVLRNPCYILSPFVYISGFVQWSCWNTIFMLFLAQAYGCQQLFWLPKPRGPLPPDTFDNIKYFGEVIVDRGFHRLWPCLIPWLVFETAMGYAWLHHLNGGTVTVVADIVGACKAGRESMPCVTDNITRHGITVAESVAGAYFFITCVLLLRKLRFFKTLPYSAAKRGIVYFTIQLWLRLGVMAYFLFCMVLLWLVRFGTCASAMFVDTGIMPMHVVMTMNAVVFCYVSTPVTPSAHAAACKVWLQEIAWTEAEKPIKLAARGAMIPNDPKMDREPVFCYETMLNLLYWSCLVYDHDRGKRSAKSAQVSPMADAELLQPAATGARTILTLETAMSLYGLTESESFWEVKQDTRCLVSWGGSNVVVAFRGTASMKNAMADLQAWRVNHPPIRGKRCMSTRPLVHVGFLKSWLAGHLNEKVIAAVLKAVQLCRKRLHASQKITIMTTGHSLGGAMATLAAYDIRTILQAQAISNVEVICYTFAAPRTGNHAFARDYKAVVPDTWSVINDQDVVTREGKLLFLYKRPGQRVIVDAIGRLIVRPTHIEAHVQRDTAGQSMKHHLLSSYFHAVLFVALAQFGSNGFPCGMPGIIRLAEGSPYVQDVLESQMGMQLAEMKQYSELDPVERTHTVLPGAHPPVRGFYLIKPSPIASLGKSARSASLMTRLRLPRCPSSTHSLVPSSSVSDVSVEALDSSMHGPTVPDTVQEDISDVVVDIDDTQLQH